MPFLSIYNELRRHFNFIVKKENTHLTFIRSFFLYFDLQLRTSLFFSFVKKKDASKTIYQAVYNFARKRIWAAHGHELLAEMIEKKNLISKHLCRRGHAFRTPTFQCLAQNLPISHISFLITFDTLIACLLASVLMR